MDKVLDAVGNFISMVISVALISGGIGLFAGEIRLAALKRASKGSGQLSNFTMRMTKTKLNLTP